VGAHDHRRAGVERGLEGRKVATFQRRAVRGDVDPLEVAVERRVTVSREMLRRRRDADSLAETIEKTLLEEPTKIESSSLTELLQIYDALPLGRPIPRRGVARGRQTAWKSATSGRAPS